MRRSHAERGALGVALAVVAALVLVATPVVLHVLQKRHDRLPYDVEAAYPPGTPLVGGEAFASTVAAIMRHELDAPAGWRPNDFVLWGPAVMADNNANRQRGIIIAVRESVRVLKDHLTKVSSNQFDENLQAADTLFRNDETKFWFPSAERRFREGVDRLDRYVAGLAESPPRSKPIEGRNVELIRLFNTWTDLLGHAHATLFAQTEADGSWMPPWRTDDYYYRAQGMAHVIYHLTRAIRREYADAWRDRKPLQRLLDEVEAALGTAAILKPLLVMNGSPDGFLANHRRNLDVFLVDARQKMYSIRDELEK
jgi:hypothetical protein